AATPAVLDGRTSRGDSLTLRVPRGRDDHTRRIDVTGLQMHECREGVPAPARARRTGDIVDQPFPGQARPAPADEPQIVRRLDMIGLRDQYLLPGLFRVCGSSEVQERHGSVVEAVCALASQLGRAPRIGPAGDPFE